jgi:hypothetical protein
MMENSEQILELKERLVGIEPLEGDPDFFNSDETYVIFYIITFICTCIYVIWSFLITSNLLEFFL